MHRRRGPRTGDDSGVSEILGVTMLLAMVITIMSGLMLFLQPFMQDLNDNRIWSTGSTAATSFNDRLLVVAEMPENSGVMHRSSGLASTLDPLFAAEVWTISADLSGDDRVQVSLGTNNATITSDNSTATAVRVDVDDRRIHDWTLTNGSGTFELEVDGRSTIEIEVFDRDGNAIHRLVRIGLDGMRLVNGMTDGAFTVDLTNGARIERLPGSIIDVRAFPRLEHDRTIDGNDRVTLVLLDIDIDANGSRNPNHVELVSDGPSSLLNSKQARNLNIQMTIGGDTTIERRYLDHWTRDHDFHLAAGDQGSYVGFGPSGRLSGLDGMTFHPSDRSIELAVVLQRVEVII